MRLALFVAGYSLCLDKSPHPEMWAGRDLAGLLFLQDAKLGEKGWDFEGVFTECSGDVVGSE